jgi:hypothetical protein
MSQETPLDDLIDENEDFSFTQTIFDTNSPFYSLNAGNAGGDTEGISEQIFEINVIDACSTKGCVIVEVGSTEGHLDDSISVEISAAQPPGGGLSAPRVVITNELSGQRLTIHRAGDGFAILNEEN